MNKKPIIISSILISNPNVIDEAFTSQHIYKIGFDWLKCFC